MASERNCWRSSCGNGSASVAVVGTVLIARSASVPTRMTRTQRSPSVTKMKKSPLPSLTDPSCVTCYSSSQPHSSSKIRWLHFHQHLDLVKFLLVLNPSRLKHKRKLHLFTFSSPLPHVLRGLIDRGQTITFANCQENTVVR